MALHVAQLWLVGFASLVADIISILPCLAVLIYSRFPAFKATERDERVKLGFRDLEASYDGVGVVCEADAVHAVS